MHQAVAIVASLKKESFLDPGAVQGGGDKKRYIGGYMVQEYGNCAFRPSVLMREGEDRKLRVALDFRDGRLPSRAVIDGYDTVLEK